MSSLQVETYPPAFTDGKVGVNISDMKSAISSMLDRCNLSIRAMPLDEAFVQRCLDCAANRGCPAEEKPGSPSFETCNIGGATIAFVTYGYLESENAKLYIANYTALTIYIEDVYGETPDIVRDFNIRFIDGRPQKTAILEAFAQLLRETSLHFNEMQTNVIIISSLRFIASIWFEYQGEGSPGDRLRTCQVTAGEESQHSRNLVGCDCDFPAYVRGLSGIGDAYAVFTFPSEMEFSSYAQAIPSLSDEMVYGNDVLSLYKEELAAEAFNCISVMARHHRATKVEILQRLADRVVTCHSACAKILSDCQPAYEAFMHFTQGYINYHASNSRYKLRELMGEEWH